MDPDRYRTVDTNISGATASTYTLVAADLGTTIKVRVSFTDDASNAETLTSAATAAVSAVVPSNWTLKPTAVAAGAKFRLLFLSSTRRNASSTDIATYNTFIQTRAANGHADIRDYSAGFRAVGCTAAVDARDNTATTYTTSDKGVPIYWLNGAKAADQYEDFYDGSWDDEANDKNESGTNGLDTSLNENWPLTGCDHDGTAHAALGASQVTRGRPNSSGSGHGPLNGNDQITSGLTSPLYGLSEVFQVAAAVVVPNNPPAFSADTAARSVAENTAAGQNVGAALTATDADSDTLTYTLEGADAASFDIVSGSGQIRTRTGVTYNHEAKSTHTVVVKADDGNGGTDTIAVTITVTDVDEPPGRPAAPTVSATTGSTTSLDVTWTAPTNTGPAIASYDLQYRAGTSGNFTNGPQNVTGKSAAIGSLMASTSHQVQVRATNAEGDGDWSFAGTGRTGNHAPVFSGSTAARSVAENTAAGQNVGAVLTATDADSDTLIYTLEGADAASFDIVSASGQIQTRTGVTYNHEAKSTHTVVVKADDGNGGTDTIAVTITVTDVDEPPGRPAAPTVSATAGSTTSLDVTWTAPTNTGPAIASYDLQYRAGTSGNFTNGPQNVTGTSAAIGSLAADTSYEVQVRATNAEGDGDWSVAGTGRTTATSAPGAPTGLSATASGTTAINLSWSAPASTGGSAITGYKIEVSPNGTSGWTDQVADTSSTTTTYAHTGLAPGDTRHYRVSAINTNGSGTPSNVDSATTATTVPGAPTGLTATASGTTQIDLSWTAPASTGGSAITGYKIEVSSNGGSSWTDQVANTNSTATTYAHTGLGGGTTRHYRVSAINTNGAGVPSNVDSATTGTSVPGAPTGLTATASGTTAIDLSWSAPGSTGGSRRTDRAGVRRRRSSSILRVARDPGSAITGYRIEVSSNGGSSWTNLVANTGNANTTYAHTGLTAGTTRHYRVSAINANGTGVPSNVDSATTGATAPGAPTGLTATASGTTAINLSWSAPGSTGGSAITGYKIEVSANVGSSWTNLVANTSNTTTTYAHTGLTAGATRHYRVSAINTNGAGTASNVANATTGQTTVTFGASSYTAAEGGAATTVTVALSAAASATVTIPLTKTHRGGATAADYSGVPSNVTFTAGQTRRTFTVTATDDADKDGGESVQLGFGTLPAGYAPGARRTATVTLVDDDATLIVNFGTERHTTVKVRESDTVWHRFTFSLSTSRYGPPNGNPQQPVTIPLVVTHRGGATPADYEVRGRRTLTSVTFGVGESVTSFSMRAIPDGRRETGEGLRLDFGRLPAGVRQGDWGPYETIAFVDQVLPGYTVLFGAESYTATEGGAPARVSIHLSEPVEIEPLVVRLVVTHLGATAADYTGIPKSVRFGVGEQTQTITVKATDDTDDDDGESVTLSFVNDPNGRVRVRTGPASATVALADNDGPRRVTVSFGAVTYTATEGGADATVRVELDAAPGRSVTVPLTKAHLGNATAADYSGIPMNVTFAANQTSRTFPVMATAGDGSDGGESVSIGFGTLPEGVFAGSPAATTVTLADGGEQRLVVNFGSSRGHTVQVREGARRLRLNVLLDSSPRRPVTIPLVVTHVGGATEADYAAIPESVTFAAGQTSAHYYVRALPDEEDETGEGLQLDFGPLPPGVRKGTWGPYETIDFLDPAPAANLSVSRTVVTMGFPWALDGGSTPSPRDFVVSVEAPGGGKAMAPVAAVAVEGSDVFLQLARPVAPDDTVTLSYLADAMHPIRDEAGSPAAPLTDAPVRNQTPASGLLPFSVPDRGGFSVTSQDAEPMLRVGYGQVETDAGMTPPVGLAIFGSRLNGILVSEAGVPASAAVLEGRIFAETAGPVRTGLALANPNDTAATITFFFTDSNGIDSGHDTFTLGPREQIARFLDEEPFNGGSAMFGTFTFTSNQPVAVIALRWFVNERSEFLMTTLPVAPIAVPATGTVYFPLFADGGGWTTQVVLVNPTYAPISGSVQFFGSGSQTEAAAPATLTLADGRSGSAFTYAIPPRSATRLRTSNPTGPLEVGSVRAVPDPGQPAPSGVSIFAFQKDGMTVSEAGVPASTSGAAFRVYVEASGTPGQPHSVRSGIALTNTSDAPTTVSLELTDLDGTATGLPESLTIPASGHIARFIDEFFPALTTPFSGILRIASTAPDIAAVGLRLAINQRHDILVTTTPPADENAAPTASDLFFPLFVDSGGWTTQFILFSRSPGQTASGVIRFTGQDGQPLELSVAPTAAPTIP